MLGKKAMIGLIAAVLTTTAWGTGFYIERVKTEVEILRSNSDLVMRLVFRANLIDNGFPGLDRKVV